MTNLLVIKSVRQDGALSSSHWQLKGVGEVVVTLTLVGEVGELVGVEEGHAVADEQLYKQSRNNQENYKERKVMSKITWKQRSSSDGEQSERSPSWSHWVQYGSSHWANFRQMWRGAGSWHEPCWDAGRIWQGLQWRYHQTCINVRPWPRFTLWIRFTPPESYLKIISPPSPLNHTKIL